MLTESSVSLLTGIFQCVNVIQRRIMLTESSVSLLTGIFQGCLSTEEVRLCKSVHSPYWDKPRLHYFIGGTCELSPYWNIPGSNCVNTKENT